MYPVAELKLIPLVLSFAPKAPPVAKLTIFKVLLPLDGAVVLVGVILIPLTLTPAPPLEFVKERTWPLSLFAEVAYVCE